MDKREAMIRKMNEYILNVLLIAIAVLVGLIIFWQVCPYDVLDEGEGNYTLEKTVYKQGENMPIAFNICKSIDKEESVFGRFIDGVIYSIPENGSRFKMGCYNSYIASVNIPDSLPPGTYTYEETVVYQVNPLKTVSYVFTTPEFEVIEK